MLSRVSTVLTGALVAGVIATGAAAAVPNPEHGQRAHHSQSRHMRMDDGRRHIRMEERAGGGDRRYESRGDGGRHGYEREGLFLVGRVLHALFGPWGGIGF